ncbi:MFS transporter [Alphaproteobacteria bacterium]|nr:MFS transporter [Alphaproteobacteria bacterium]
MKSEISGNSWLVWGIATLFYLYELVLRVSPSVMTNELMSTFGATSTTLGVLISFYYYSYTVLQIPCGLILDKLGPLNILAISALFCVFGAALFAGYDKLFIAQIGRFLIGAGSACAFVSCLQITAHLFPKKYFVILAGVTNMMGTVGGLLGGFPVAKAVGCIGWRNTTLILGLIGILIIVCIFLFVPKKIDITDAEKPTESVASSVMKLLKNSQIVLSGIIAGMLYLPISAFSELWAIPFFMSKYGISSEQASLASAALFIGVAIGSLVLAIFARKMQSYTKAIKIGSIGCMLSFIPLLFVPCSLYTAFFIVFCVGFFTGAQVINFTCAKNNATKELAGTAVAFTNCIVMLVGSIFQPLLGVLLDVFWTGKISETGCRIYDISCYKMAIMTLPVCILVAYILSIFQKETIQNEID